MTHIKRISEMFVNEGAGAGYTIVLKGVSLDENNIKVYPKPLVAGKDFDNKKQNWWLDDGELGYRVEIGIRPCVLEKWETYDYYNGCDSESDIELEDGVYVFDDDEDKRIDGGFATTYFGEADILNELNQNSVEKTEKLTAKDVKNFVKNIIENELPNELTIKANYGGGWVHVNLVDETTFKDVTIEDEVDLSFSEMTISAKQMFDNINLFYEKVR